MTEERAFEIVEPYRGKTPLDHDKVYLITEYDVITLLMEHGKSCQHESVIAKHSLTEEEAKEGGNSIVQAKCLKDGATVKGVYIRRNSDGYPHHYLYMATWDETEIDEYNSDDGKLSLKDCFVEIDPSTILALHRPTELSNPSPVLEEVRKKVLESDEMPMEVQRNERAFNALRKLHGLGSITQSQATDFAASFARAEVVRKLQKLKEDLFETGVYDDWVLEMIDARIAELEKGDV